MSVKFPSDAWAKALLEKLNNSPTYAETAKNWEGDFYFVIEPDPGSAALAAPFTMYLDLWHGKCRDAYEVTSERPEAAFVLAAPLANLIRILKGELDPMQAMATGKLKVHGNIIVMMKSVPTVLEFVKTAQQVESDFPAA